MNYLNTGTVGAVEPDTGGKDFYTAAMESDEAAVSR